MNKTLWAILGFIVLVLVVWIGFSRLNTNTPTGEENTVADDEKREPIKLGAILSLTGPAASFGEFAQKGISLAVEEINQNGGMDGRKIEVVFEDDTTDGTKAVTAFNKLVDVDKVDGVIGGVWDFLAQTLLPLSVEKQVPFISGSNFRIAGSFDLNDYSFVMLPDFEKVLRELSNYFQTNNVKKVAAVRFNSDFGKEISETLDTVMQEFGKEKIIDETYSEIGTNDFRTTITKLKQAGVDTVFLDVIAPDGMTFLKQAKELDFKPKVVAHTLITDALSDDSVDKSLLEGVVVLNWNVTNPEFEQKFSAKYNTIPSKSANRNYDAVYILAQAAANRATGSERAQYIEENEFTSINGTTKFTSDHAVQNALVKVQIIQNGKLVDLSY